MKLIYITGAVAHRRAHFGQGSGSIEIDDVRCTGSEQQLSQCSLRRGSNCDHSEDASVSCQGKLLVHGY